MMANGRMSRWPGALIVAALALLLVGCALPSLPGSQRASGPQPLPDARQVAQVALQSYGLTADMFDPLRGEYVGGAQVLALLYSGLLTLDARQIPVPALATSYDVSADGLRYTFHLRPGARFAEGTPLTSADAAFSLNRVMSDCFGAPPLFFPAVKDIAKLAPLCQSYPAGHPPAPATLIGDSLLTPDPTTLIIVLSRPDAALPAKLAEPYSAIVEQSLVTRYGDAWTQHLADGGGQGTSGMYALTGWRPWTAQADGQLILDRAPGYWGPRPRLSEVNIAIRTGEETGQATPSAANPADSPPATVAVAPGDDIVYNPTPPVPASATTVNGLIYHTAPVMSDYFLALDTRAAPLDDVRVRQALALALDKTALAPLADSSLPTNHLIPPGMGAYPSALSGPIASAPLTGDQTQARALWQSYVADRCGGAASACPAIQVFSPQFWGQTRAERAIMARWKATLPGLRLTVIGYDGTLQRAPQPSPVIESDWWSQDYPDPQDWLAYLVQAPGAALQSFPANVDDPQAAALVARAEASLDPTARLALYQQAENALINDAVVIPIAQGQSTWAVKPTVANFPANPAPWIPPAAWARIELMSA